MPLNPLPPDRQHAPGTAEVSPEPSADEREYEAFAQAHDPLDLEAATWVARRRNGLNPKDEAELQDWLAADPRHAEAFADMDATFSDVKQLPDSDVAALKAGLPKPMKARPGWRHPAPETAGLGARTTGPAIPSPLPAPPDRRPWRERWGGWRPLLPHAAAAAIAFALVGGGWMGWDHWRRMPTFEQTFATARGQQLTAILPDANAATRTSGSRLQLDTATRVEVRLYRDRREARLNDGQAMFSVEPDAERPFHVWAGALRITVLGTRFSVRHTLSGLDAGQTIVSVEEGRVRVAKASRDGAAADESDVQVLSATDPGNNPMVELNAGQKVVADSAGRLGPVVSVPASSVAPWRSGRISFDQTPLAQAIAEFERYGRTGLVVRDPAVAALPVGGSYSLQQWQRFTEALPQVLPVRLERRGEVTEVVAR